MRVESEMKKKKRRVRGHARGVDKFLLERNFVREEEGQWGVRRFG